MKVMTIALVGIMALSQAYSSCAISNVVNKKVADEIKKQTNLWKLAVIEGDVNSIASVYTKQSILMPEYQPTLNGLKTIRSYYSSLNNRRTVSEWSTKSDELFSIDGYVCDFGTFVTTIKWGENESSEGDKLTGKYWRLWQVNNEGDYKIRGEIFGFHKPIDNTKDWVTNVFTKNDAAPSGFKPGDLGVELKAFHALGQQGVLRKDGELRAQLYTDDAVFFPFADTAKRGIDVLRPYLKAYSNHSAYIDYLQTHTHDVIYLNEYVFEFTKFNVGWSVDGNLGQSTGKGMRLWKRLDSGQLRIFRHFGTHNY